MTHGSFSLTDADVRKPSKEKPSNVGAAVGRRHSAPGKIGCDNINFSIILRIWTRLLNSDARVDPELALQAVSVASITDAWICSSNEERLLQGRRRLYLEDKKAITACMNALVGVVGVDDDGRIDACEWLYQALLRYSNDSIRWSIAQLSSLMRLAGSSDPGAFDAVRNTLQFAEDENGSLRFSEAVSVYCKTVWKAVKDITLVKELTNEEEPLSELLQGSADDLAKEILDAMELEPDSRISCSGFMVCCLGRPKREVLLHQYDLTGGYAKTMSMLQLDGIWHTGLVVYDKEYFFNGQLVLNDPGKTSFGTPTKILHVGYTHRRKKELHAWVVTDLKHVFTRAKYDIVDNNCNHFTNSMAKWLCDKHLPDEVMGQADRIKRNPMLGQVLKPIFWVADSCHCNSSSTPSVTGSVCIVSQ